MDYPRAIVCVSGEGSAWERDWGREVKTDWRSCSLSLPLFPRAFLGKINKSMYADEVI